MLKKIFILCLFCSLLLNCNGDEVAPASFQKVDDVVTRAGYYGITITDLNNDGKPDLISNSNEASLPVILNTASSGTIDGSSFTAFKIPSELSTVVRTADFDGDGKMDIVAALQGSKSIVILRQKNTGASFSASSFEAPLILITNTSTYQMEVADFDNDRKPDIAFIEEGTTIDKNNIVILRNNASPGSLTAASFNNPVRRNVGFFATFVAGDLNADFKADFIVTHAVSMDVSPYQTILVNTNTTGSILGESFTALDYGSQNLGGSPKIRDMDGDGRGDIISAGPDPLIKVMKNSGSGLTVNLSDFDTKLNLILPANGGLIGFDIIDINNDQSLDVIVPQQSVEEATIVIFRLNFKAASFTAAADSKPLIVSLSPNNPQAVVTADFDGDGKNDIGVLNITQNLTVLRNVGL